MSIIERIKSYFRQRFNNPVVYAKVAELLREGHPIVKVRYRNAQPRYYMGTGQSYNNKTGHKARWMMTVCHFERGDDGVHRLTPQIHPWLDNVELELLQKMSFDRVFGIDLVSVSNVNTFDQVHFLKDILRRLKPGQGYNYSGAEIKTDLIQPDGYLIHLGSLKYILPERFINTCMVFPLNEFNNDFKVKNLYVADEKKIKRQHRLSTDLKRWTVITPLVSTDDPWVVKYTHSKTAAAPVFYYGLTLDIDSKLMKGHPFYITELINSALKEIVPKHDEGHYEINAQSIIIKWEDKELTLPQWLDNVSRFPTNVDVAPVMIYKPRDVYTVIER